MNDEQAIIKINDEECGAFCVKIENNSLKECKEAAYCCKKAQSYAKAYMKLNLKFLKKLNQIDKYLDNMLDDLIKADELLNGFYLCIPSCILKMFKARNNDNFIKLMNEEIYALSKTSKKQTN
jgi:hypothetical protein